MMMKVLSEEETNIRTLNYAPGPLVTDMTDIACKNTKDMALRNWFEGRYCGDFIVQYEDDIILKIKFC